MRLLTPRSVDDALDMMAGQDRPLTPIAGGTDLLVSWPHVIKDELQLLDLSPLHGELGRMTLTHDALELGALTSYWDVISSPEVSAAFPLLACAGRQVGAIQIQTRGTWAGNVANGSPAADGVPVLMAYDAVVVLQSAKDRVEVPLHAYFTGYKISVRRPDQLIVAIRVPRRSRAHEWFHKVGARFAQAIAKVGVAAVKDDRGWRVVANSVAPFVKRCPTVEQALNDARPIRSVDDLRALVDADISPINDIRSTADYRANVLSRLLYFWLRERQII